MGIRRLCFVVVVLFVIVPLARATDSPRLAPDLSRYEGRTIESVDVSVEEASLDEASLAELRARVRVTAGQAFSAVLVRESLQALFDNGQGRVADARVEARDAAGAGADGRPRVALRFIVRPQVIVGGVSFQIGADYGAEITPDELRSRVTLLEPGKRISEQSLRENADAVQAYLRDRGFYRAEVTYTQQLDATRTRATVVFNVNPGQPATLNAFDIQINGFDASNVRRTLKLQPGARFTQAALGSDVSSIRQALISQGYLAPRIEEPAITLDPASNRVSVSLKGSIGPKVSVNIKGYKLSEQQQRTLLPVEREGTIEYSAIIEGARRIRNQLQQDGYFFAEVTPSCSVIPPLAPPPADAATTQTAGANAAQTPAVETDPCELLNPDELANRNVSIIYDVAQGRRFKLTDIRIEGTSKLSYSDVSADLNSQKANLLGFVPLIGYGRGYTSEEALSHDERVIKQRMADLGYRNADVSARQGVSLTSDNLIITFAVTEGPLTRVVRVETRGNEIYTAAQLRGVRCPASPGPDEPGCVVEGGPYSRTSARADGERMRTYYVRNGYVDAEVQPSVDELPVAANGDEQVRLVYTIKEADKVFINHIIVAGLVNTKKEAVLEAIPLREGEVLKGDDLAESERILLNTSDAFSQVLIRTEDAGITAGGFKRKDVIIDIQERKHITTEYIVGFSTDTGGEFGFEVRDSNLFGQLKQGAIRTRFSKLQQLARFEYTDPRFRRYGRKSFAPLTFSVQYQRDTSVTRFFRSTIDQGTNGIVQRFDADGNLIDEFGQTVKEPSINRFSVNLETQRDLEFKLTPSGAQRKRTTVFLRYNYEDVRLFNIGSLLISNVLRPDQVVRLSRFGASFARDTRDRQFDPTRGDFLTADYALALRPLGGNISFNKFLLTYRRYQNVGHLPRQTVLAGSVQLGLANILSPTDRNGNGVIDDADRRLPISERFFSGGATSLRGFGFEEAGPRVVAPFCTFGPQPGPVPNGNPPPTFLPPCGTFHDQKGNVVTVNPFTVPIGGNAMAVVNLEARIQATREIQVVPFYDGGNVFDRARDLFRPGNCEAGRDPNLCQKWTHTAGLGLRLKTPLGSIGADWAYLLNPPEFVVPQFGGSTAIIRLKRTQIHFRFGQTF
ncbi:MAG TPA: POTRA domain-containing protein [Pyrinomonadaceae bacterium]|nr:POTRA domain-containing protein [Pyrinomonadaceae bacterium]